MCFGALSPCPVCKDGKLAFRNGTYCCTGHETAWSSCRYTTKDPIRAPIDIPKKFQKLLGEKVGGRTRILRDIDEISDQDFV